MKNENNILFRKHPLGFTILQQKDYIFEPDDQHIFFHGQKLISSSTSKENGNKLKSKKLRGLKRNEEKGRMILKNLGLFPKTLLVNPRYEECYFKLNNNYFSVTYSGQKIPKINHFNSFVTNGCLFGSFIQGVQADGKKFPLIDHQLKIDSPIQNIIVENKFHLYEHNVFNTLTKHISLMKKISINGLSIIYHLPVSDYILLGILRFTRGEMSFLALNKFIVHVKIRGDYHKKKLKEIAKIQQINITILSPFDNICDTNQDIDTHSLLNLLEIRTSNSSGGKFLDKNEEAEKKLIKRLLFLLETNEHVPKLRQIWHKLIRKTDNSQPINSLKDILRLGNASVIAYSTIKRKNRTCAWFSADEYPVFAHYKRTMSKIFGEVPCFSSLPSLLNYVGMDRNGSGQQTLFRYLPAGDQTSVTDNALCQLPSNSLKLSSDNNYIRILNYKLHFFLYFLSKNNLTFLHNFPRYSHTLYQSNENWLDIQTRKKILVILSKDSRTNYSINYYLFFGNNNEEKIMLKDYPKIQENCYLML